MELETYLREMSDAVLKLDRGQVLDLVERIERVYREGRTLFLIGNGGSGANASHFCEDLGKGTLRDFERQRRLRVISLTDNTPYILAWGNDEGFDRVFVEQLRNLAQRGDLLIGISCSGNSPNVLRAFEWARANGLETYAMTARSGGRLAALADTCLRPPTEDVGDAEALHGVVLHYVVHELYERFGRIGMSS